MVIESDMVPAPICTEIEIRLLPPSPPMTKPAMAVSDAQPLASQLLSPTRMPPVAENRLKLEPNMVMLADPVTTRLNGCAKLMPPPSNEKISVELDLAIPDVTKCERLLLRPWLTVHATAVSEVHWLLSHALWLTRTLAVFENIPIPIPSNVRLTDAVEAELTSLLALTPPTPKDHASVALPSRPPAVTETRWDPE